MYVSPNFKTKKALKEAVAEGRMVTAWQPGIFGTGEVREGSFAAEGPHYPEPHRWYAEIIVANCRVVSVK